MEMNSCVEVRGFFDHELTRCRLPFTCECMDHVLSRRRCLHSNNGYWLGKMGKAQTPQLAREDNLRRACQPRNAPPRRAFDRHSYLKQVTPQRLVRSVTAFWPCSRLAARAMDDTDEFSDDGLDDSALQELENNAAHFPRAAAQVQKPSQISQEDTRDYAEYGWGEDDDLDTTEVINDAGAPVGRPVVEQTLQHQPPQARPPQSQPQRRPIPPVPDPKWNPTVDPANRPSGSNLANRSRVLGAGPANLPTIGSQTSAASRPQPSQFSRPQLPQNRFGASQNAQAPPADFVSALQQRVRVLEAELNAARGESSIIRSNSVKTQQQYDAEVARLRKLNAEQMAKQERIVEAAVAAEKTANTELQFLQRDMREVNDRARRKEQATGGHAPGTLATTPRKTKTRDFADGFDDMDIAASPSKGQGRSRNAGSVAANVGERTPSKGKRKRPVVDSPVRALETHTGDLVVGGDKPAVHATVQPLLVAPPAPPFEVPKSLPNQRGDVNR